MHVTAVLTTYQGELAICQTCGERAQSYFNTHGEALEWCDTHERAPKSAQSGPRLGLKALEALYRDRSTNPVYEEHEQAQWLMLADEIADRLKTKKDHLDGQDTLFDFDEGEARASSVRDANYD